MRDLAERCGITYRKSLTLKFSLFLLSPVELTDGRGGGRGAESYDSQKEPGPLSINHSILSDHYSHFWIMVIAAICFVIWRV